MSRGSGVTLAGLGPRIVVMGPSGSGKSTLADAIARGRGLPAVHLDRLHHLPNTDWQPRPRAEFVALHDAAIDGAQWVMDGNYAHCLPRRLARATGCILLDAATPASLFRYLRRCWFERDRKGALEGGSDRVTWDMIRHILIDTRATRSRYRALLETIALPVIELPTRRALAEFYRAEGLRR